MDASVAVAFVLDEEASESAERLFAAARAGIYQLAASPFFLIECANACRKRAGVITALEARAAFDQIVRLPVTQIEVDALLDVAVDIALANNISTYDAVYVATAEYLNAPMVTADRRLLRALSASGWRGEVFHIAAHQ